MGIDIQYMAVPLDAEPLRRIRTDPQAWAASEDYLPFARPVYPGEPLPEINQQILAVVPDGTRWVEHFPGREWQQAEYLLDPAAFRALQTYEQRKRTMPYRIIQGDEQFADHALSGQGMHWRCSTTAFLTTAVRQLDDLNVAAVRREFSVAEMENLGVYKVHDTEEDQENFDRVLGYLREFADYCRDVVAQNLDMIATLC